ncbi:Hypothetical protein A7982_01007 [Minicystis rosea]|nr:Hypothetical protein A7982_01007 [Minicystis rosea]
MSHWTKFASIAALSFSMALAGAGCVANNDSSDEMIDEPTVATQVADDASDALADEKTGEADQEFFFGCRRRFFATPFFGFGFGCGLGCGLGFGGCGFGGWGGGCW